MGTGASTQEPAVVEEQVSEQARWISSMLMVFLSGRHANVAKQQRMVPVSIPSLLIRSSFTSGTSSSAQELKIGLQKLPKKLELERRWKVIFVLSLRRQHYIPGLGLLKQHADALGDSPVLFTASSEKTQGPEGVDVVVFPGLIFITLVALQHPSDIIIGGFRYFGITETTLPIFFEDQILNGVSD